MNTKLKYLALSIAGTTALFLGMSKVASAITINPSGYTFINPSGSGYPDSSGEELTDGVIATENWNTPDTFVNRLPYVGWIDTNPIINFTFDSAVNIDALTLSVDDSGGAGAVTTPLGVNITMNGTTINRSITDPPGIEPFSDTFSGLGLSGTSLELEVIPGGQWTFLSEVSFDGSASVPFEFSPSLGLLTVGGILGFTRLRKWKAAQKSL